MLGHDAEIVAGSHRDLGGREAEVLRVGLQRLRVMTRVSARSRWSDDPPSLTVWEVWASRSWTVAALILVVVHAQTFLATPLVRRTEPVEKVLMLIVVGAFIVAGLLLELKRRPRWQKRKLWGWPAAVVVGLMLYGAILLPRSVNSAPELVHQRIADVTVCVSRDDGGLTTLTGHACDDALEAATAAAGEISNRELRGVSALLLALALLAAFIPS